jgi:hypothetical protein
MPAHSSQAAGESEMNHTKVSVSRYEMRVGLGRKAFEYEVQAHPVDGGLVLEAPIEKFVTEYEFNCLLTACNYEGMQESLRLTRYVLRDALSILDQLSEHYGQFTREAIAKMRNAVPELASLDSVNHT